MRKILYIATILAIVVAPASANEFGKQNFAKPWTDYQIDVTARFIDYFMIATDNSRNSLWELSKACLYSARMLYTRFDYDKYPDVQPPKMIKEYFLKCAMNDGYKLRENPGAHLKDD